MLFCITVKSLKIDEALRSAIDAHKKGNLTLADQLYTSILKTKPDHCEANYNIGVLAFDLGKRTEAISFFKRAIDSNSSIELYWKSYVQALLKLDKVDEAKSAISKAKT